LSNCSNWIDCVNFFFIFQPDLCQPNWCYLLIFLSMVSPLLRPTSPRHRTVSCLLSIEPRWTHCICFIFRQRFIPSPPLLSLNWSICTTAANHPSPDSPTPTIHCYKGLSQPWSLFSLLNCVFIFASSLARAQRHRSSIRHRRSLSPLSHAHRPST
jgi:hypothetical protein